MGECLFCDAFGELCHDMSQEEKEKYCGCDGNCSLDCAWCEEID